MRIYGKQKTGMNRDVLNIILNPKTEDLQDSRRASVISVNLTNT